VIYIALKSIKYQWERQLRLHYERAMAVGQGGQGAALGSPFGVQAFVQRWTSLTLDRCRLIYGPILGSSRRLCGLGPIRLN
jgi:hypothetical protein